MFGITLVMHEAIKEYIDRNEKYLGTNEKKYLRMSSSFYGKFMAELFDRVGNNEGQKMIKDFKGKTISYTDQGSTKELVHLEPDAFFDLADGIIEGHCKRCKDQRKECVIREMFINSQVPFYNESGVCPYYPR